MNQRWILSLAMCSALCGACTTKSEQSNLEILDALTTSVGVCEILDTSPTIFSAFYDPTGADAYNYFLKVRNNLPAEDTDPVSSQSATNIKSKANDVTVTKLDICWYRSVEWEGNVSCDELPKAQNTTVRVGSAIVKAGGLEDQVVMAEVLTIDQLRVLYGSAFDPRNIPTTGEAIAINGGYSQATTSPTITTRDTQWGDYPDTREDSITLKARAIGTSRAGKEFKSGWFTFSFNLCVGCVNLFCGIVGEVTCPADICDDGLAGPDSITQCGEDICGSGASICPITGVCSSTPTACSFASCPTTLTSCVPSHLEYSGSTLSFDNACLIYQGFSSPTCTALTPCE